MPEFDINTDEIIDSAVQQVFEQMGRDSVRIKKEYFEQIQQELQNISIYFTTSQKVNRYKRANKLTNPYAPEYGFSQTEIAYQISKEKAQQALVYNKINKILSYLRESEEITYSLYVKDLNNRFYRYEVPENEIESFTTTVQSTTFKFDNDLREYASVAIERLENALDLSQHIEAFMKAVDSTGLNVKLADKYEAYEYHYQKKDRDKSLSHEFNIEGIRKWILGRGHDTAGWWVRGDVGLTSVKSVNLNNKFLFLNLASQKSLQEVYGLLKEIFIQQTLSQTQVSKLVKAFTPAVYEMTRGINVDIKNIVENLINSLMIEVK